MYYLCFDVGITGYYSLIEYNENNFTILESNKIEVELKEDKIYKKEEKSKSKSMVKNQVSFLKNYNNIKQLLLKYNIDSKDCLAFLEQLTPRPINSRISVMSLGDTGGCVRSIIECLNINYLIVPPGTWKDGINVTSEKETSINFIKEKVENKEIIINDISKFLNKQKNYNHNQVESVLIAFWHYKTNYKK